MKDLAKTSILSKRWLNEWAWASRTHLNFHGGNVFKSNDTEEEFKTQQRESVAHDFVTRVDRFMQNYKGEKISSLRVDFLLGSRYSFVIDRWIGCAISKGAERIELLFSNINGLRFSLITFLFREQEPYKFPHTLLSGSHTHIQYLHLQNYFLLPPAEFSGFKNLTTLVLHQLLVTEDLLLCLFSKCFHLEDHTFKLRDINSDVNIVSPTLRHLKLLDCGLSAARKIDIVAINLSSFEYSGNFLRISSIKAPQLLKFYLNTSDDNLEIPYAFAQFANLHRLENLTMYLCPSRKARLPRSFGPFQHLRQLELFLLGPEGKNEDYLWVLDFVMASPHPHELSLIIVPNLFANQRQRREHTGFSHSELKYVELRGCVGNMHEIELASHFLKNVNSLQQITFSPCGRYYIGDGRWVDGLDNPHWFQTGRNLIREMLQAEVNEQTRLYFCSVINSCKQWIFIIICLI